MATYYSKDHEWITVNGAEGVMGITAYAAQQLGDVVYVDLPAAGKSVKQHEVLCAIESVKAASDIYAPLSGSVTAVNDKLATAPELVNQSAEQEAWIATLTLSNPAEVSALMDRAAYDTYVAGLK
ncbi:MAG TPA: glycine cleavage system protein GcvH [bacterium]|nr:glycine cleavage system protein GcvH [bacterium]